MVTGTQGPKLFYMLNNVVKSNLLNIGFFESTLSHIQNRNPDYFIFTNHIFYKIRYNQITCVSWHPLGRCVEICPIIVVFIFVNGEIASTFIFYFS